MLRLLSFVLMASLAVLSGCAQNYYNLPQDSMADRARVLGIVPIITDVDSDIRHPQKEELIALLAVENRNHERDLLRMVKNTGSFYTVTTLDVDPASTFRNLLFRREKRDDAAIQYNKYFWKEEPLAELMRKNSLDALMFVIVSGITRVDKQSSSNFMDSLESEYNFLIMTAQIVDPKGTVLWEYPNFRTRTLSYDPFVNLQYAAFDEAKANMSGRINLKFKTIDGIKRALDRKKKDLLLRQTGDSELYMKQFDEMTSMLTLDRTRKPSAPPEPARTKPAAQPAVKEPVAQPTPKEPPVTPSPALENEKPDAD